MVRLAGIEPTTLGFGGSDFPLDCGVSQSGFPMVLSGNCEVSELLLDDLAQLIISQNTPDVGRTSHVSQESHHI